MLRKVGVLLKKHKKIIIAIISVLVIITGGYTIMRIHSEQEKAEMIKIAKAHQKEMDEEVRYGDKDHHIKTITYEWDTVYRNPMGGFYISGYINNNKKIHFQIHFDKRNGELKCWTNSISPKLAKWKGIGNQ